MSIPTLHSNALIEIRHGVDDNLNKNSQSSKLCQLNQQLSGSKLAWRKEPINPCPQCITLVHTNVRMDNKLSQIVST